MVRRWADTSVNLSKDWENRFESIRFEVGDWQDEAVRAAIEEHNLQVQLRWLSGGGDPARSCWWHITEITLDHLRQSPTCEKQMADLKMAKGAEAAIRKGLKALAKRKQEKAERLRLLQECAAELVRCPVDSARPALASA